MNGKNCRIKGRYSRGIPSFTEKRQPVSPFSRYILPKFSNSLKTNLNVNQLALVNYFETYNYINEVEEYSFNSNTPGKIITLKQSDFAKGTVRITKPGIYVLLENINFEPNIENDFMPTTKQITSGQYPVGRNGAYHLGFFAAITIETNSVILDLNKKTIQQTKLHSLQQRFFADIETASSPFIPKQGPSILKFADNNSYKAADTVLITNGYLSRSSHHGIHGNKNKNIMIYNMIIENFEVAGCALNGAENCIINNVNVFNTSLDIKVISLYSQARFIRTWLDKVKNKYPTLTFNGKTIDVIIENLNTELENAKNDILNDKVPKNIFGNKFFNEGYDGNVYGMVFNVNGIVINDFLNERLDKHLGNKNIHLQNINIKNIISRPVEIEAINNLNSEGNGYGKHGQTGPNGDILEIKNIQKKDETYDSNVVSDAQLIIAKVNSPDFKMGTTSIEKNIVAWAEGTKPLSEIMKENNYYCVEGGDSMGHIMKGNIGLFFSGGEFITGDQISIENVISKGDAVKEDLSGNCKGSNAYGIVFTASKNISLSLSKPIKNITSENPCGESLAIKLIGVNENIAVN